ncbi:hypothetical protein KJ608_03535, partial [Patescibacteria group bacterium]|nr:hypothetical protein [Patescibacteria group bacterium]
GDVYKSSKVNLSKPPPAVTTNLTSQVKFLVIPTSMDKFFSSLSLSAHLIKIIISLPPPH